MNKTTRILIASGTAVIVAVTSFAVTAALTAPAPEAPVSAAIDVPEYSIGSAELLAPVTTGEPLTDSAIEDSSLTLGSTAVVLPGTAEDSVPEDAPSPAILEAVAALEGAGGDTLALGTSTEPSLPDASPEATPASDPCAEGTSDGECPDGATVRLFALDSDGLAVWGTADPPTAEGMGSFLWCEPTVVPDGALRLGALTNGAAAVSISYWPQGRPAEVTTVELAAASTYPWGDVRHCGETEPLDPGIYEGSALAISAEAGISEPYPLYFDSRGAPTAPGMKVVPLGSGYVWVGMYHVAAQMGDVGSLPVVDGAPGSCDAMYAASAAGARSTPQVLAPRTVGVTRESLERMNALTSYTRLTSAVYYVAPGTTAGFCGRTWDLSDPHWDTAVPETQHFATATAPGGWEARVTWTSTTVYRPGYVTIQGFNLFGTACGAQQYAQFETTLSDDPFTQVDNRVLCGGVGGSVFLDVRATDLTEGGAPTEELSRRIAIAAPRCVGDCPAPEPASYLVALPGLHQAVCPGTTDESCDVRRRVRAAQALINVTWTRAGGGADEAWSIGASRLEESVAATGEAPMLDENSAFTSQTSPARPTTANATMTLRFSERVTYEARLFGDCPWASLDGSRVATGTAAARGDVWEARITYPSLCAGQTYRLAVTFTDADGNTVVAAPAGTPGIAPDVVWTRGLFLTDSRQLRVTTTIEVSERGRPTDPSFLVWGGNVTLGDNRIASGFPSPATARCYPGATGASAPSTATIAAQPSYTLSTDLQVDSDRYYYPNSAGCAWRTHDTWVVPGGATVTLDQLLAGWESRGIMHHRTFGLANGEEFAYRVTLRGEYVDE